MKTVPLVATLGLLAAAAAIEFMPPVRVLNRLHPTHDRVATQPVSTQTSGRFPPLAQMPTSDRHSEQAPVPQQTFQRRPTPTPTPEPERPSLGYMRHLLENNPGMHRLNGRILTDVFAGRENEVVCTFCLLQVLSIVHQLGNATVRRELETALASPKLGELGDTLLWAASAEKETLSGTLLGYYQQDQLQTCDKQQEQLEAVGHQLDHGRCEAIREFITDIGRRVDFTQPGVTDMINAQVERATGGKIQDLFSPLSIDTKLVFASALVFADEWRSRMHPRQGVFHAPHGDVTTEMLFMREEMPLLDGSEDGVVGVSLPYDHKGIRMFVFTTSDGTDIRQRLKQIHYERLAGLFFGTYTNLTLPSFDIASKKESYIDLATDMGMGAMFQGGMGTGDRLRVDQLQHKAVIKTDKDGTEAAGAAGVAVVALSAKPQPFQVHFDRPFVCSLSHVDLSGVPFFTVYVADPTAK